MQAAWALFQVSGGIFGAVDEEMTGAQYVRGQRFELPQRGQITIVICQAVRNDVSGLVGLTGGLGREQDIFIRNSVAQTIPRVPRARYHLDTATGGDIDSISILDEAIDVEGLKTCAGRAGHTNLRCQHSSGVVEVSNPLDGARPLQDIAGFGRRYHLQAGKAPLESRDGATVIEMDMGEKTIGRGSISQYLFDFAQIKTA